MLYRVMVQHGVYFALKLTRKWAALGKVQTSLTLLSLAPSLHYKTIKTNDYVDSFCSVFYAFPYVW